jgi:hypothetical protein
MPNNIDPYTGIRRKCFTLRKNHLDFARQHDWKESNNSVFRVNTAESYEALNLKSNGKNKYNIILSIGEDKVTKNVRAIFIDMHIT